MCSAGVVSSHRVLIEEYEEHLAENCGVTAATGGLFSWHVSVFLAARFGRKRPDLKVLRPTDAIKYVTALSHRWKPNTRRSAVTALRSFLRWAQMRGLCAALLANSVPTVSSPRSSGLPLHLSKEQLDALLRAFERNRGNGSRNYAAVLCMARLGLRVAEVVQITLDDIDWKEGTLRLPLSKGRRERVLPLPCDVGQALVDYLRRCRPPTKSRHVFVSHQHTTGHPLTKSAMRLVTRNAFIRAGLNTPSKGTRVLRHTAATHLIRAGSTIKEIADILGHSSIDTTCIYAKVDIPALAEAAAPWPMGGKA